MDLGIESTDPFGAAALFIAQSMAERFDCHAPVQDLLAHLLTLETPQLPNEPIEAVLGPIDHLLDRIEPEPGLVELVEALLLLAVHTPPQAGGRAERLFRSVLWTMMRHAPALAGPQVLQILRDATPGRRPDATVWPSHEFFAAALVLVYLGGADARRELTDLMHAAQDLGYHDLAPVLDWYLDHPHSAPAR